MERSGIDFQPDRHLRRGRLSRRSIAGTLFIGFSCLCTALALSAFACIVGYVAFHGVATLNPDLIFELPPPPGMSGGGIANAIVGTCLMVALGTCFGFPLAFLAAIYLAEFGRQSRLSRVVAGAVNLLSATPSIILGLFAYATIVLATGTFSAVAGGFALALVMLPIMVRSTEEALRFVPDELRQGSLALGASHFQTIVQVVLPSAVPSIITGAMLAVARATGESAPLIFTALFSQFWADSAMAPTASLAVLVYNFATSPFQNQQQLAWSAALVLIFLVLTTNIVVRLASRKRRRPVTSRK